MTCQHVDHCPIISQGDTVHHHTSLYLAALNSQQQYIYYTIKAMRLCNVFCSPTVHSAICLYTIKVCWIIINHTRLQGRLRIYFREPGPLFRPALPLPSRLLIHLKLWYFTAPSAVWSRKLLWMNRSNPDVWKRWALPTATLQKAAVNGMFWQHSHALSKMALVQRPRPRWVPSLPHLSSLFHYVDSRRQQITRLAWHEKTGQRRNMSNNLPLCSGVYLPSVRVASVKNKKIKKIWSRLQTLGCPTQKASAYTVLLNLQVNYSCVARQPRTSHVKTNLNLFHTNCSSIMLQFMRERERNGRNATFYKVADVEPCNTRGEVCRELKVSECIDLIRDDDELDYGIILQSLCYKVKSSHLLIIFSHSSLISVTLTRSIPARNVLWL